jgi:hypothetical protein
MVVSPIGKVDSKDVWERVRKTAFFAKSVLHLPFSELDMVNPSFTILSKYCDLLASLLREQTTDRADHERAACLAEELKNIAIAIVDRDDESMIDSMAILDQFLNDTKALCG